MKNVIRTFIAITLVLPAISLADVNGDLNKIFDNMGMESNTTAPHAYQGQQAGYYTGGSLYARSAVKNVQLVEVDLPSYRAGCGGIDLYLGGFSYVNSTEINEMLKNVMNGAKAYAFKLALSEVTPLIKSTLSDVEKVADEANKQNMNSCETAEELVGGVWPKTRASQQQICEDVGSGKGIFKDWTEARQGCTTDSQKYNFDSTMNEGSKDSAYKNMILDNGNIVWNALKGNNLINGDTELAELLMSLSGSIIIKRKGSGSDANNNITNLESLAVNHELFTAILYGGQASIYRCDETDKCLNPTVKKVTITDNAALRNHFAKLLQSISQKIIDDEKLTNQELGLIQATPIPIYKILNVQAAYQKDPNILDVDSYADVIATDVLFQYLTKNLEVVKVSSGLLQYPEEIMAKFTDGVNLAMSDVRAEERNSQNKINMAMQLIEQSQVLEQMLAGQLSAQVGNSMNWANSLH